MHKGSLYMKLDRIIAVRNSKTVYCEGDHSFKVFNGQYKKSDVLSEALNQARLEETGLNIPKILEVTVINGKWAIVYEHIKGKTLSAIMNEQEKGGQSIDGYIEKFADLQLDVLKRKCPELTPLSDKITRNICETDFAATVRYDLLDRLSDMPKHAKICHGDFNPSNIIITEKGDSYILDWSHAAKGNGAADAAGTYLYFLYNGQQNTAESYMNIICQKSGVERSYVERWLPIIAASKSAKAGRDEKKFYCAMVEKYI